MSHLLQDLSTVSFFGRPYTELLDCFGLTETELFGESVLECPSGPSSFVVEANRRGIQATGVDPVFYRSPSAIEILARADFKGMFERVRLRPDLFVAKTYGSIEEAERARFQGLLTFLADYRANYATGRYRSGALPRLDFEDRSFDRVLCGHLLFVYSDRFGCQFHLSSVRELCRVARREVRIHPLVDAKGEEYPHLDRVFEAASEEGFDSCICSVQHEFFKGSNRTVVLRRR